MSCCRKNCLPKRFNCNCIQQARLAVHACQGRTASGRREALGSFSTPPALQAAFSALLRAYIFYSNCADCRTMQTYACTHARGHTLSRSGRLHANSMCGGVHDPCAWMPHANLHPDGTHTTCLQHRYLCRLELCAGGGRGRGCQDICGESREKLARMADLMMMTAVRSTASNDQTCIGFKLSSAASFSARSTHCLRAARQVYLTSVDLCESQSCLPSCSTVSPATVSEQVMPGLQERLQWSLPALSCHLEPKHAHKQLLVLINACVGSHVADGNIAAHALHLLVAPH
jgi:hypothetical protein